MPRGKKKLLEPTISWEVQVPRSLSCEAELLLTDPLTGKVKYGAKSKLLNSLLRDWLEQQRNKVQS